MHHDVLSESSIQVPRHDAYFGHLLNHSGLRTHRDDREDLSSLACAISVESLF